MARKTHSGRFFVPGDFKERNFETKAAATSLAIHLATVCKQDKAYYVREITTQGVLVQVERVGKVILTRRVR